MDAPLSRLSQMLSEHRLLPSFLPEVYQNHIRGNHLVSSPSLFHHILAAWLPQACSTLSQAWGHSVLRWRELVSSQSRCWQASHQPRLASVLDWTWTLAPGRPFTILVSQGFLTSFSSTFSNAFFLLSSLRLFTSTVFTIETGCALTSPSGEWSLVLALVWGQVSPVNTTFFPLWLWTQDLWYCEPFPWQISNWLLRLQSAWAAVSSS